MSSWWERHVVPRVVDRTCGHAEVDKLRGPVCAGLHGDVLELGFGSGLNVRHYPSAVRRVGAVEPSDLAWRMAAPRIAAGAVEVQRVGLDGQHLDVPDDSYDSSLSTFTLCSIPDAGAALAEVRRVLRPGGTLAFVEHGLSPDPGVARWQRRITPVQRRVAGGCHLDRPVRAMVEAAGFEVVSAKEFYGPGVRPFVYLTLGSATAG
jgi:ubiquinone/menaquinone biosynthesis C-methylase UbiE